tara:strand:- start:167 stop:316 length:150 start_codon:yes stop_codon:yes gene_type:complete
MSFLGGNNTDDVYTLNLKGDVVEHFDTADFGEGNPSGISYSSEMGNSEK